MMLAKLEEITKSKSYKSGLLSTFGARTDLQGFLARRCSKEFLTMYLEKHPELLAKVSEPGLMLSVVPEVRLAKRLHEFGLLPEENRKKFVKTVSDYAAEGQDTDALDSATIRSLFTDDEHEDLVRRVRTELVPKLGDVRREHESNHGSNEPPEEHIYTLLSSFDTLKKQFADDAEATKIIDREIRYANEWIGENTPEEPERKPRTLGKVGTTERSNSARSIFDDVDADGDSDHE